MATVWACDSGRHGGIRAGFRQYHQFQAVTGRNVDNCAPMDVAGDDLVRMTGDGALTVLTGPDARLPRTTVMSYEESVTTYGRGPRP